MPTKTNQVGMEPTIVSARITPLPQHLFDPMPKVIVVDSAGSETTLFEYYPDEISFTAEEFIGKTIAAARQLKFEKDRAYLRS
jgi:hypothetical protein